jgi:PIN domain nuclease of toxin-antitoxin system
MDGISQHAAAVEQLPFHRQDPFDRLLIAQALTKPLHLLTHDALVVRCSDTILNNIRIKFLN